jgi:D-alanyl-D-alanine carboxypeptidase
MHINTSTCPKCESILNTYPNPYPQLTAWVHYFRTLNTDAHISACGRGVIDQNSDYSKGVSRAKWGESAHNYNAAVDFFRLTQQVGASFDPAWYRSVLGPAVALQPEWLVWGGTFTTIVDLPHVEVKGWAQLAQDGQLTLVQG